MNNASNDVPTANVIQWLYDGLYVYDQNLKPVPDLAAEEAKISADGKTWTVKLRQDATFQPTGTKLTADDVVFTYELSNSPNCRFNPSICLSGVTIDDGTGKKVPLLTSVKKIDDYTVEFTLANKYAPFLTVILPGTLIDSKEAVMASFDKFNQTASSVKVEDAQAVSDKVAAEVATPTGPADETGAPTVNYAQFQAEIEAILNQAGVQLPDPTLYQGDAGLDTQAYASAENDLLTNLIDALSAKEIDQVAAAYTLLDVTRKPVGSGPFYVTEFQPGQNVTLAPNPVYHMGAPKLTNVFLPIIKDSTAAAGALAAGQVDWQYQMTADAYAQVKDNPDVKVATYPDFGFFGLYFNNREGALFSDKRMRQAAAYCFDKDATVQAATSGNAVTIDGDIPPASWAYNPDVTKYPLDPDKGNQLIQDVGYAKNAQGIYEKDGKPLSTIVLVRQGKPDRIKFMQLWAQQVNENCGMDMKVQEADFATVLLPMINNWPLTNPATGKPFDLYFGGFGTSLDPDPYALWHSSQIIHNTATNGLYNFAGYNSPEGDKLIEKGLVELDQDKRAEIYHQFEQVLSDDLPMIFAWSDIRHDGVRATVNGEEQWTPDNMDSPTWFWKLWDITNQK